MSIIIFFFLTHINEYDNRRKHRKGRRVVNISSLGYNTYSNKYDNNLEFNSENLAQSFGISKRSAVKKIRGNPLIADISEYRFQYDDINAKGLTSYD
jgi:hypothetical protein